MSAWVALAAAGALLAAGVRRWGVVLAIYLAVLAAGAALRTLRLAVAAAARRRRSWSALRAPTAAGMIVHLGVVVLATGVVVSTAYATRSEVTLRTGQATVVDGQRVGFYGFREVNDALETSTQLAVRVGSTRLRPAVTTFTGRSGQTVGTPAIDSNLWRDVYVTFNAVGGTGATSGAQLEGGLPAGSVVLGVTVEPLLSWLWIGGLTVGIGAALSLARRRHAEEDA